MNNKGVKHTSEELFQMIDILKSGIGELTSLAHKRLKIINFADKSNHDIEAEYIRCDNRLKFIFNSYALAVYMRFGYSPTIVVVNRTRAEQDYIYSNHIDKDVIEAYKQNPWISTHQTDPCRAIDSRDNDMSEEIKGFTRQYFNQVIYTGVKKTYLHHDAGFGSHFHFQVDSDDYTSIKKNSCKEKD